MDLSTCLPPVSEFRLRPWNKSYGGDFYGALEIASDYCRLHKVPPVFPGVWQHGVMPPWQQFQPEILVFDAPRSLRCFVARKDEVHFLAGAGYDKVRAIGLPIIYTKPSGLQRIPGSLLVMPTHSLPADERAPSFDNYVGEIASIKGKFSLVAACVSATCIAKGFWAPQFEAKGIQVIRGADISDANALRRMRALFESFEFVTTNSYGSHLYYAVYFGARVSIWGEPAMLYRENVLKDDPWAAFPGAVDRLFSEETEQKAEEYLGPLRVDPWIGVQDVNRGRWMLGHDHKLSPFELRACFGWTPTRILVGTIEQAIRRSQLWRAGAVMTRRLLALARGISS